MAEEFLNDDLNFPSPPQSPSFPQRNRETVRIIVVGSQPGIEAIIYTLFSCRFAAVHEWSRPQPDPHSGKLISIMTRSIWLD